MVPPGWSEGACTSYANRAGIFPCSSDRATTALLIAQLGEVDARHIPASVKRAVWERDGGRCTFVGENGHRCDSRTRLEYDHVEAVGSGGHATIKGLRLRCRAHNQYEAEKRFGRDFLNAKRGDNARPAAGAA
jgi:hypothetical protein